MQTAPAPRPPAPGERRNKRVAFAVAAFAFGMLGMSFAAVPLYDLFCRVTGFGGTPLVASAESAVQGNRVLTVRFDANVSPELNWTFRPEIRQISLRTGVTKTVWYRVTNNSDRTMTGMATYNVSPDQSGAFFNKISCFCFTDKTLDPGETVDMPVVFFLDPALEKDQTMQFIEGVTLSYTFIAQRNPRAAEAPRTPGQTL